MSYGLRVDNPSGVLVFAAEAMNYRYLGQPTLITSASSTTAQHTPYLYRITMPDATSVPIVAIQPSSTSIAMVSAVFRTSGSSVNWDIEVVSVSTTTPTEQSTMSFVAPTVRVFTAGPATGQSYGLHLFDSGGNLAGDFVNAPLWIRQVVNFSAIAGGYAPPPSGGPTWTNQSSLNGDSATWDNSNYSTLAVFGSPNGGSTETQYNTGDPLDECIYGWSVSGNQLSRKRIWWSNGKPLSSFDPEWDTLDFSLGATKALLIDASLL